MILQFLQNSFTKLYLSQLNHNVTSILSFRPYTVTIVSLFYDLSKSLKAPVEILPKVTCSALPPIVAHILSKSFVEQLNAPLVNTKLPQDFVP
jgi:hypothetical protein